MVKYIAIEAIDKYKIGDEVPEGKAVQWLEMFKKPPVKEVEEQIIVPIQQPIPQSNSSTKTAHSGRKGPVALKRKK